MGVSRRRFKDLHKRTLKHTNIRVLKKLAIAFAIALLAAGTYIYFLSPHTLEAKQRTQLESTQRQLLDAKTLLQQTKTQSQEEALQNNQKIEDLNKELKETQDKLQAKLDSQTAAAAVVPTQPKSYPMPEDQAKAFIYMHESGNNPRAINKSSGACGLGQALPCSKLPCSLDDYACQDAWFTQYMLKRYKSWSNAVAFWQANRWW